MVTARAQPSDAALFDRGALGLDDDHRILISQHLRDTEGARDWLIRFAGEPIRGP